MPWFGFYSEKQRKLIGYAEYITVAGYKVPITQISKDINYIHPYSDSIRYGHVIYFCGIKEITDRKYVTNLAKELLLPFQLRYVNNPENIGCKGIIFFGSLVNVS